MSFKFKHLTVLAVREHRRDQAAAKLAGLKAETSRLAERIRQIEASRRQLREAMLRERTQIISAQSIKSQQDFCAALQHENESLSKQLTAMNSRLESANADLLIKHRECTQLEILRRRDQTQYNNEAKRVEQREHDEIATLRHCRPGR